MSGDFNDVIRDSINGSRRAQRILYNTLAGKMFGLCLRYAHDETEARDILQDGFVKVFKNLEQFRFQGSFEGWVRKIMVNTALEHFRKESYQTASIEDVDFQDPGVGEKVLSGLSEKELLQMIRDLSPQYRVVFNLYAIEGYSHKEISQMLNISEGTSKSNLSRARNILKEKIKRLNKTG